MDAQGGPVWGSSRAGKERKKDESTSTSANTSLAICLNGTGMDVDSPLLSSDEKKRLNDAALTRNVDEWLLAQPHPDVHPDVLDKLWVQIRVRGGSSSSR